MVGLYKSDGVAVATQVQSLHDVSRIDVMRVHSIATKEMHGCCLCLKVPTKLAP
jgi:hypothetical protein